MPPIKEISLAGGIRIVGDGIPSIEVKLAQFPVTGTLASREAAVNKLIQGYYEDKTLLSSLLADDPARLGILADNQRIEKISGKEYLIATLMWVQVHLYSLSPLKYTIRCSDFPITEEWW